MLRPPQRNATGMLSRRRARETSLIIISRRLLYLSAQTPATSPRSRKGSVPSACRTPICAAEACRIRTAVSGKARPVNWSPRSETASPYHILRKSRWCQRLFRWASVEPPCPASWSFPALIFRDGKTGLSLFELTFRETAPFFGPRQLDDLEKPV